MIDIAVRRLHAQRLLGEPLSSPVEVVRLLGAVQSQDYAGATWALGQRTAGSSAAEMDLDFDQGRILRTHVLRPTWHFVLPEDLRRLLSLTGGRVRRSLVSRYRELDMDEDEVLRARALLCEALAGGNFRTRPELGAVLRAGGIPTDGQRLPHFLMAAELDGMIVSGPRRGKQFTYALLAERVPAGEPADREEALHDLVYRYFRSHGPAQLQDFVWWSGLTLADARRGIALAGTALRSEQLEGKEYWSAADAEWVPPRVPPAHLLPNWDEYTVAYRDRTATLHADRPFDPTLFSFGSVLSNVVTIAGRVRGAWRRTAGATAVRLELRLLDRLDGAEEAAVEVAARRFGDFLQKPVDLDCR